MSKMSRDKGKRYEREAAKKLTELLGVEAKRGIQFRGGQEQPDLITDLEELHFEVKATERLRLHDALEQATRDSRGDKLPVMLYKKNHKPWVIAFYLDDVVDVVKELSK